MGLKFNVLDFRDFLPNSLKGNWACFCGRPVTMSVCHGYVFMVLK